MLMILSMVTQHLRRIGGMTSTGPMGQDIKIPVVSNKKYTAI